MKWPEFLNKLIPVIAYSLFLTLPAGKYWTFRPLSPLPIFDLYISPALLFIDFFVIAILVTNLRRVANSIQGTNRKAFAVPLLGLGVLASLTSPWAILPSLAVYSSIRWWLAILVYYWLSNSGLSVEKTVKVFLLGLGINVLIGFGQIAGRGPLGIPGELAIDAELSGAAIIEAGDVRWLRPYGLTFHPNVLGGYLATGLLLGLPLLRRRLYQVVWLLLLLGLVATFSRAAWLATALTLPAAIWWLAHRHPRYRHALTQTLAIAALVGLGALLVFSSQLVTRLRGDSPTERVSIAERQVQISVALDLIREQPWTGVGAGNFPLARSNITPQPVHNVFLLLAAEIGVLEGLFWLVIWLRAAYLLWTKRNTLSPWPAAALCAGLALGLISLFDSYPWGLDTGRLLTVTALGLFEYARGHSPADEDLHQP